MAEPPKQYYELYRRSTIGLALTDTLDDLISSNKIEPQLALKVLAHFDKAIADVIAEKVRARLGFKACEAFYDSSGQRAYFICQGQLSVYRFCDEVWTFVVKDVTFKLDNSNNIHADRVKIVSLDSRTDKDKKQELAENLDSHRIEKKAKTDESAEAEVSSEGEQKSEEERIPFNVVNQTVKARTNFIEYRRKSKYTDP